MKRIALLTLMLCLGVLGIAQQATRPQWTKVLSDHPATFKTELLSSTESSVKVNVQVPGFYTTNVNTPNGEAKVITLPKSVSTAHAGEPDMPMTGIPVMIGDKARMDLRVLAAQYTDFEGIEVAPSKGDFPRSIDPATVPYTYGECYQQDAFFPASSVELYEPYIIRDFRGQNIAVHPFAYNPVTKTLRVYYDMTVEMYKVDDKGANVIESRRGNVVKMDPDFKSVYQRHFINYEAGTAKYTPVDEEGDLLIICYDSFISSMTDFVNWKKTRGLNTTIVGTSTAGTSYSAIKTYIQNQYNANNNLTHVLLVGDVAQIPGHTYSASGYDGIGDNPYGQVAGSDVYNDIFVGRFSAQNAAQVTTQVNRVITYERDLTTSATWLQKADGVSRNEGGSGHNGEDDYEHMDVIRTDLLNYGYNTVYQDYENLSGYTGTASSISSHINSGVGIVNYCNHGDNQMWAVADYSNTEVNALTNENKLPFIWSVACLVGKYDNTETTYGSGATVGQTNDCFAEAWMHATNSAKTQPTGAVGALMSYISQPWIPPMWGQDECVDILVESYSSNIKHTWGGVSINGIMGIFDNYSTSVGQALGTYQAWVLYGDPSMMLRTKTPQAMTVTHDGTIALGSSSYSVTVSNGDDALATITDADHNILGTATVSNNTATVSIDGELTAGDELTLCVFGYNKVTYLGTIEVVGGTQYTISATANPTAGGTVTGAGVYYENQNCTLTATANRGYEFTNWKQGNTVVSTDATYTFAVSAETSFTANFTQLTLHALSCPDIEHGTVTISPTSAYKGETITLTPHPDEGYCLQEWNVTTNGKESITVIDNQFVMPDGDVTVDAIFKSGYTVTLADAMNGTISADPLIALDGTTITLTATPDDGYGLSQWVVFKTGDASTAVTVTDNQFTMPAYDVTVTAIFSQPQGGDVTIGSGNSSSSYLPTYTLYNYSLTQQIYTASEVSGAGTITAIAFKVSNSISMTRTLDVYLKHTTNTAFSSQTGWVSMSTSDKVFSGSVTFSASGWTTITFDTPFAYDGTSNLIVCVDDNTGSWESGPHFYIYSTGTNRALRIYNDDTNYDPASPSSYSGSYVTSNNQIIITKETPSSEASIVVSPTQLADFTYNEGEGPSEAQSFSLVACINDDLSITAPTNYEISQSEDGPFSSSLTLSPSRSRETQTWGFEGDFEDWTTIDADGDGFNWKLASVLMSGYSIGSHGGDDMLSSQSYDFDEGALTPDNWLVSPQLTLGGTFTMYACGQDASYAAEHFGIYVSTGSNTNTGDFVMLNEWTLSAKGARNKNLRGFRDQGAWYEYSVDLSAYAGQSGYIAIRHYDCTDQFYLNVDDFTLDITATPDTPDDPDTPVVTPTSGTVITTDVYVRLKSGLSIGEYNEEITLGSGETTASVSLTGEVTQGLHWTADDSQYASNMSVFAIIQIEGVEQRSEQLEVGGFCDDECRGSIKPMYCPPVDRYILPMMIYGNTGDAISFKLYDHEQDLESVLTCTTVLSFSEEGYGSITNPVILNFTSQSTSTVTQTYELTPGWHWWSTYIETEEVNVLESLKQGLGSSASMIKSTNVYITYNNGSWNGSLSVINNESCYIIMITSDVTFEMTGPEAASDDHPIAIKNGWNWIGYPCSQAMTLDEVFSGFTPSEKDMIKSEGSYATYTNGSWTGSLNTLEPGHGYMYLSNKSTTQTLTLPTGKSAKH